MPFSVVIVAPWVPRDDIGHAGGVQVLQHARELAAVCQVTLLAPADGAARAPTSEVPGIRVVTAPMTLPTRPVARRLRHLRWLVRGLGPGPQELAAVRAFLHSDEGRALMRAADLVEIQYEDMLPILDALERPPPVVLWAHDVVSEDLVVGRHALQSRRRRLESRIRLLGTIRAERRLLPRCDAAVVFKPADENALRARGFRGGTQLVKPALASPDPLAVPDQRIAGPPTVVIVAAFDRPVNLDGLTWFLDRVWPSTREVVPDAHLVVAGAHAPSLDVPGVEVVGFVSDLAEVYSRADVAIVPARAGAGLKFTVAQALANGLPVVSTSHGARGYTPPADAGFLQLTDDPGTFADALRTLLTAPDRGRELGRAGRDWWRAQDATRLDASALLSWYTELAAAR